MNDTFSQREYDAGLSGLYGTKSDPGAIEEANKTTGNKFQTETILLRTEADPGTRRE